MRQQYFLQLSIVIEKNSTKYISKYNITVAFSLISDP